MFRIVLCILKKCYCYFSYVHEAGNACDLYIYTYIIYRHIYIYDMKNKKVPQSKPAQEKQKENVSSFCLIANKGKI